MLMQPSRIITQLYTWIHTLYTSPPKRILQKIKAKIAGRRKDVCTEDVFEESPKYTQPQRMTNFFLRYERIVRRVYPDWKIDFEGRRVLEIGGGPFFGWGLFAIFMGCARYVCVEPEFNPSLLEHPKAKHFFWLTHKDLTALFGPRINYADFKRAIKERVVVYRKYIEDFTEEEGFDILLSNSTFEHIHALDATLTRLKAVAKNHVQFLHVVDFGNHRDAVSPLKGLYTQSPEQYFKRHGKMITLKKAPDILRILEAHGFPAEMVPYYSLDELPDAITPWWQERYTYEDLLLKVGIFINRS